MAVIWLRPGEEFSFSTKDSFSGSAQGPKPALNHPESGTEDTGNGTYVESLKGRSLAKEPGYAAGGKVRKPPLRGPTRNFLSTQEAADGAGFPEYREQMGMAPAAPPAQGHKDGGRIGKAFGGGMPGRPANLPPPQNPQPGAAGGALSHATLTMPVGEAAQAVKRTFGAGRAVGAQQAMAGRGRPPMPPGAATALGAAPPPAPVPQGVPAMAKGGHLALKGFGHKG